MKNIFWIALQHLKLLSKDRTTYLLLLLLPLALTFITGLALGEGAGHGQRTTLPVALVDHDGSEISRYIGSRLDSGGISVEYYEEKEARELVIKRDVPAALIIPDGFAAGLQEEKTVGLTVVRADLRESPGLVEEHINSLVYHIRANAAAAALGEKSGAGSWNKIFELAAEKWEPSPAVEVKMETIYVDRNESIPTGNRQSSPGYVVLFGMMTVITAGGASLLQEREEGTLARLLSAPVNEFQLFTGKGAGLMASGMLQMAVMITAGYYLFNVEWGRDIPALILLVAGLSFASTGFGMLLAAICRTGSQAEAAGVLAVLLMSMLGGTWWPVELLPSAMQTASKVVPAGWAMQGFTDLIMRQGDLAQAAVPILVLFAFGAAFLSLGIALFRYRS